MEPHQVLDDEKAEAKAAAAERGIAEIAALACTRCSAARTEPQARRNPKVELDLQPRRYGAGYR